MGAVVDRHRIAAAGGQFGDGGADAPAAAGNEHDFGHGFLLHDCHVSRRQAQIHTSFGALRTPPWSPVFTTPQGSTSIR
ncbi:hypothetical protein G6F31_021938 [Rhizopus arrhizus]|nr:hypothetical protein G6F31_021938 [Rhizopus arrhizus]